MRENIFFTFFKGNDSGRRMHTALVYYPSFSLPSSANRYSRVEQVPLLEMAGVILLLLWTFLTSRKIGS